MKNLSKIERYLLVGGILIFIVSLIFWTAQLFYKKTIEKPVKGGIYNEGLIGQPTTINPLIATNDVDRDFIELIYSDLLDLIEDYQTNEEKTIWTFTLKNYLFWSDGQPITSDDILFTLEAIKDPDTHSPLFSTWQGIIGERLNERQFRLILRTPYVYFLDNVKKFKPIPAHIFENIPPANLRLSDFNLEPISSGPYKFISYNKRKDGFITQYNLEINEAYFDDKPFIQKFNFKFYSNKEELLGAFNNREIDALGGISCQDLDKIKTGYQIFKINIPSYYAIFLNSALNLNLKENKIRQALTYATNKEKIITEVFNNCASIINGPIIPGIKGYNAEIYKDENFDLEKAQKIIESVNKKKDGLEFSIIVPEIDFLIKTVNLIKNDWENIGIEINLLIMPASEIRNEIIKIRNYEMLIFGVILKSNPDIFSFWHSSERFYPGGNLALFNDKKADILLESLKTEFDEEIRNKNLTELQNLILQERPAIFLFSPLYLYITNKNLKGFDKNFLDTSSERFTNINKWYLKQARVFK